jgi:tRNA(Arg) A34 adenosine deaminase TadA
MTEDEAYLRRALELAEQAARAGEVPIGAVLVSGDMVLEAKRMPRCCSYAKPPSVLGFGAWATPRSM